MHEGQQGCSQRYHRQCHWKNLVSPSHPFKNFVLLLPIWEKEATKTGSPSTLQVSVCHILHRAVTLNGTRDALRCRRGVRVSVRLVKFVVNATNGGIGHVSVAGDKAGGGEGREEVLHFGGEDERKSFSWIKQVVLTWQDERSGVSIQKNGLSRHSKFNLERSDWAGEKKEWRLRKARG